MIISDLEFSYNDKPIFSSFNLSLHPGLTIMTGPSGSGKTTLLKLISSNLIPVKGDFSFSEKSTLLVVQEDSLLPWLTGWQNLSYFLKGLNVHKEDIVNHPGYFIVSDFVHQRAWEMSYGQRRAIELFRAILAAPSILCLDEPLNYLDPIKRKQFASLLSHDSKNIEYIIITTHEINDFLSAPSDSFEFTGIFPVTMLTNRNCSR